jgi:hypothetical protein
MAAAPKKTYFRENELFYLLVVMDKLYFQAFQSVMVVQYSPY